MFRILKKSTDCIILQIREICILHSFGNALATSATNKEFIG